MTYEPDFSYLIHSGVDLVRVAGGELLRLYNKNDTKVEYKSDNSPVTEADKITEYILRQGLEKITPDIPVVGEEGAKKLAAADKEFWLVDPIDGTNEFINRTGEFTINIGLIVNGKPVFGVVLAPVLDELYYNSANDAFIIDKNGARPINAVKLPPKGDKVTVFKSRSNRSEELRKTMLKGYDLEKEICLGSSLKMCRMARGDAHIYPLAGASHEWDTAAAHAILKAAGGHVCTYPDGKELTYGKNDFVNPPLLITGKREEGKGLSLPQKIFTLLSGNSKGK